MLRRPRSPESPDLVGFRLRGREITRLESFSDAVFGFALTLLVVSLDVPKTFDDLVATMRGFPAFALCFLFLALIWNGHYRYCRRYGLDDGMARFLTCVMLFLVLFYVYPLKFLFNFSITGLFGRLRAVRVDDSVTVFSAARDLRPGLRGGLSRADSSFICTPTVCVTRSNSPSSKNSIPATRFFAF